MRTDTSQPTPLDLTAPVEELTATLLDLESVSGDERTLADAVEAALRTLPRPQHHSPVFVGLSVVLLASIVVASLGVGAHAPAGVLR